MFNVREVHLYRAGWALLLGLVLAVVLLLAGCGGDGAGKGTRTPAGWAAELGLCDDPVDVSSARDGSLVKCGLVTIEATGSDEMAYQAAMMDADPTIDWCYVLTGDYLLGAVSYDGMRSTLAAPIADWAKAHKATRYDDDCHEGQ